MKYVILYYYITRLSRRGDAISDYNWQLYDILTLFLPLLKTESETRQLWTVAYFKGGSRILTTSKWNNIELYSYYIITHIYFYNIIHLPTYF